MFSNTGMLPCKKGERNYMLFVSILKKKEEKKQPGDTIFHLCRSVQPIMWGQRLQNSRTLRSKPRGLPKRRKRLGSSNPEPNPGFYLEMFPVYNCPASNTPRRILSSSGPLREIVG